MKNKYTHIGAMIRIFFGQDSDAYGDNLNEIIASSSDVLGQKGFRRAFDEANNILENNSEEQIETIMDAIAGDYVDPRPSRSWKTYLLSIRDEMRSYVE